MKTTLDLPDELIRAAKLRAVVQGRTLKDLAAEFFRHGLGMARPIQPKSLASPMVTVDKNGLPVIRCVANAPAAHMSMGKLLQLEQKALAEEDLRHARIAP